jgi:hypothetical protein
MRARREGLTRSVPPGSENRACPQEDPPGTWETSSSPSPYPEGAPGDKAPGPSAKRLSRRGANAKAHDGTAKRSQAKCGGMGDEESEDLVVPRKPGNSACEDPVEGRGSREQGTERGKDAGDIGLRQRLNETRADS